MHQAAASLLDASACPALCSQELSASFSCWCFKNHSFCNASASACSHSQRAGNRQAGRQGGAAAARAAARCRPQPARHSPRVRHRRPPHLHHPRCGHARRPTLRRSRGRWTRCLRQLAQGRRGAALAAAGRSSRRSSTGPGRWLPGLRGSRPGGAPRRRPPRLCAPCSRCRRTRSRRCRCAPSSFAGHQCALSSLTGDGGCELPAPASVHFSYVACEPALQKDSTC